MSSLSSLDRETYVECKESDTFMKKPWSGYSSEPVRAGTMLITCRRMDRSFIRIPGVSDAIFVLGSSAYC
ncbi:hypothetical protein ACMD2_02110 [Ananas comosus]|uniref:Uncharacterized protein n=1 Tax=Ananas comosus TaxID=4615 RepID=A0A199UPZ3_ANACO|nr:hypothetical protein ACMD2_02110 [Ananas comosus]